MERKQSGQGNGDGGTECSEGQKPQGKVKGQPDVCTELGPGAGETPAVLAVVPPCPGHLLHLCGHWLPTSAPGHGPNPSVARPAPSS